MARHSFPQSFGRKLCGNCAFPQNLHARKLGEITVFYPVITKWKFQGISSNHQVSWQVIELVFFVGRNPRIA